MQGELIFYFTHMLQFFCGEFHIYIYSDVCVLKLSAVSADVLSIEWILDPKQILTWTRQFFFYNSKHLLHQSNHLQTPETTTTTNKQPNNHSEHNSNHLQNTSTSNNLAAIQDTIKSTCIQPRNYFEHHSNHPQTIATICKHRHSKYNNKQP